MLDVRELLNLKEAYAEVYAPQELTEEQIWEEVENWVNSLLEEGYDLSDYTWEEMYEAYINEDLIGDLRANAGNIARGASGAYQGVMRTASNVNQAVSDRMQRNIKPKSAATPASRPPSRFAGARDAAVAKAQNIKGSPVVGPKPAAAPAAAKPAATTPAARPSTAAPAAAKPASAPAGQTGDKAKDMATFAKANPKLAAASAERDRTRGTSATTNPLMKDMKSRLPAPKTPAPSTAKTGFDLAKKGVNLAAGFDPFDVVMGHLLDEGYADTQEAALAIMTNMSEGWRDDIFELYKGRHGQSEKEYMDDRSQGGKMISGDSKESGASYSHRSFRGQGGPVKPGKRQPVQGKMDRQTRADMQYRKANLKNR